MIPKKAALLLLLVLALAAPLAAQLEPAPTALTVSAPSACTSSDPAHYTCAANGNLITSFNVNLNNIDTHGCTLGTNCHLEYCFAASPVQPFRAEPSIMPTALGAIRCKVPSA